MSTITQLIRGFLAMLMLTFILGFCYPLIVTGVGKLFFAGQVNGGLIAENNQVIGSKLMGQNFHSPQYFFARPSASDYNGLNSGGSNLSAADPQLTRAINARIKALIALDPSQTTLIPIDLVTSSGSGLDPDISVASAYYQAPRIARLRHLTLAQINQLIAINVTPRQYGFLGEPRVNVLNLNLALDQLSRKYKS